MTGNNRNLLIDGDFQAVDLTSGHSGVVTDTVVGNYTSTVPTGWSSSTGGVGDFAPTATPSPAFAGSQVAYLGSTSQLSQSFGTGPGNSGFGLNQYLISLDIGTRADIPPLAPGTATIVATVGSTVIGQVTYTATAATAGEKTHLSFVTADLSALGLAGQNVTLTITDGTDTQILVDNVVAQSLNPNFLTDGDFQSVNLNPGAPGVSSDSGGSHTGTAPTGWTSTVAGAGAFAPNSTASTAFAGAQVGYIVPNGSLSQSFTPTVVTGGPDPILISLDLGTRIEAAVRATSGTVTITASVGATVIGQTIVNASSLTAGGETHLSFATSDLNALGLAGQNVTLSIANATNGQILIDNVVAQGPMVFSVTDEASLNAAIKAIDASGADAVNGAAYQINITGPISLTSALDALNLPTGASLTIAGMSSDGSASQVQTIDGGGAQRGFFVYSGNVTFENLIIQNTLAKGGNGADSGGGGAGLGGGLFVANDTWNGAAPGNVTLVNVSFGNDKAQGGNGDGVGRDAGGDRFFGGGGGLGQDGLVGSVTVSVNIDGTFFTTYAGGGGGIGSGSGAGIVLGARGGGVGGDSVSPGSPDGGVGGTATNAGGGGGGVGGDIGDRTFVFQGGHGGFGGGGGAGRYGGVPNFGGNGGFGGGGGGGASNQFSVGGFGGGGGGGASGSPGGFGAGASLHGGGGGLGAGGDIFVMQGATLTIAGGTLADGTVTGGTGAGGALNGTGFGAGIFIEGNQSVTFGTGQTAGQTTTIDGDITDQTGSHQAAGLGTPSGTDRADGTSNAGTGSVIITGSGTVVLDGDNTYTGDTTVQGGTLQITAGNNLGSGKVALNNGTQIDMVVVSGSATLSNAITGAGQFVKDGAGTAVLGETGGANTYTGGTVVQSGTLVLADDTSTGSGSLTLENGTAVDLTGIGTFDHPIALNGDPTIEVDSGTTTDTGVISGAGGLVKIGAGTLALNPASGSNTYSGGARVDAGTLAILSGTATSVTVSSGGTLAVAAGGGANGAVVTNGGALTVSSGGSASGATVSSGGTVTVFDGGTLAGAVGNDGTVTYDISGTATFGGTIHALTSGGTLVVSGGGALDVVSAYTGAAQLDDASTLEFTSAYVGVATFSGAPTGPGGTLKFDAGSTGPINVANPNDTVIAQPGNNNWINAAVTGNSANDTFVVYNSADVVIPQAGSHDLVYSAVNYILPTGVDSLVLEAGTQAVGNSDAAGDTLYAANAGIAQTLTGNSANDTFVVYNSADTVIGQAGSTDTVYAAVSFTLPTNVDTLFLEGGSATQGTGNSDTADALYGNAGVASTLVAGSGADALYVTGAAGTILTGAAGHDTFAFPNVMGHDEVTDFGIAKDMLQFNATLFSNFTAAMNAASQVGANTVFTIDTNDTVTLDNVTKSSLTSSNFHFT